MNERNYTLANPTRHIKAGEVRRVAARAFSPVRRLSSGENAVKALCSHELFMQNVKMNRYVCKENNGFPLCSAKHSANGMECTKIVAGAEFLTYRFLQKITKLTQTCTYLKKKECLRRPCFPSEVTRAGSGLGGMVLHHSRGAEY